MGDKHLSAPECIIDLYSLFTWVMPKSDYNFFGSYGLSEAFIYDMDVTLDLFTMQIDSGEPYYSIRYSKGFEYLWCKDIRQYEQNSSKKRDC